MTPDHPKLMRLIEIMRLMNSDNKGMTINGISAAAKVETRTIYRYFKSFKEMGLDVEKNRTSEGVVYRLKKDKTKIACEVLEFMPPKPSSLQIKIPSSDLILNNAKGYILFDNKSGEISIFTSPAALVKAIPLLKSNTLWKKLLKHKTIEVGDLKITKAPIYSIKGTRF